ncbi:RlpA-like protein precursor [compost metagenome]
MEIINVENDKSVIITVNDRGPLKPSREFDLSQGAFKKIGKLNDGIIKVKYKILK